MYFKQFLHNATGCASYFLASRESGEAIVVDPQLDCQEYIDLAVQREYHIRHVVDTHLHADHVSGNRRLAAMTGARLWLHAAADVAFPFQSLREGDQIQVDQLVLTVLHTPGHRPESISLLVTNYVRSPQPSLVLSGDTMFVGDVGRPDFGGAEGAEQQYRSTRRLLELPDWVELFPSHFEGSCGKSMCGRPSSTIGFERRFNPVLQLAERDFLELASEPPARPLNMSAILATNQGRGDYGWVQVADGGPIASVSPSEASQWIADHEGTVIDVREPSEYAAAHIPGAVSIPQADLALRLGALSKGQYLLVACQSGARSLRSARFLKAVGYERVANLEGGTRGWIDAGQSVVSQRLRRPRRVVLVSG